MSVVLFPSVFIQRRQWTAALFHRWEGQSHPLLKTWAMPCKMEQSTSGNQIRPYWHCAQPFYDSRHFVCCDKTDFVIHFPANTSPATLALSPQHTPTAPYPSAWTLMSKKKRRRMKRRQTSLKITAANNRTSRSTNTSCTTPLHTSCSSMAWSRPQPPARGIWTGQSQGPWLTAGAQHLKTTSHQAGPVLSAPRKDPSLQMVTSTRQSPLPRIL